MSIVIEDPAVVRNLEELARQWNVEIDEVVRVLCQAMLDDLAAKSSDQTDK
jgi:hypothetical protein